MEAAGADVLLPRLRALTAALTGAAPVSEDAVLRITAVTDALCALTDQPPEAVHAIWEAALELWYAHGLRQRMPPQRLAQSSRRTACACLQTPCGA
jgi:hypothetical protein